MRLLPRTVQGTWLLAGAVWLAACGVYWWLLPPQPRWKLPATSFFMGFLLDGRTGVSSVSDWPTGLQGPIQVWDMPTGQLRASYFGPEDHFRQVFLAWGHWLVVVSQSGAAAHDYGIRIMDASTGEVAMGPTFHHPRDDISVCLHPNGRLLAYTGYEGDSPRVIWYDVEAGRQVQTFPGYSRLPQFSPDGRWFAYMDGQTFGQPGRILRVKEVPTGREQLAVPIPGGGWLHSISPDGSTLLVYGSWSPNGSEELRAIDVATGQVRLSLPYDSSFFMFAPDSTRLIVEQRTPMRGTSFDRQVWLCWYDLTTGEECAPRCPTSSGVWRGGGMGRATPDGRYLGLSSVYELPSVYKWLARIPLFAFYGNDPLRDEFQLHESATGRLIRRWSASQVLFNSDASLAVSTNLRLGESAPRVWDVPPRKPVSWLAGFAALSAFVLARLARRRVRKLRRFAEAAA